MTVARALALALSPLLVASPLHAHDWYVGLRNDAGQSCCDERDCRAVELCVLPEGKEGIAIDGACVPIPWDRVLPVSSPDGQAHACWLPVPGPPRIRCVILPGAS